MSQSTSAAVSQMRPVTAKQHLTSFDPPETTTDVLRMNVTADGCSSASFWLPSVPPFEDDGAHTVTFYDN